MLLKDLLYKCKWKILLTSVSSTDNSTYTSVLQPNPCLTNTTVSQVNLTSTADNTDNSWCDHKSVSRSHVSEKYNLVSLSQLNTVNNTDTVIDLNLNTNHLIDQPFSMDQQGIVSATGTFYYGIMEGEISTPLELFWPIHFTRISIPHAQVWPVVWPQVKIVFVNQASRLGLLLAQVFYSLWSYMWRIPYYNLSCHNL